jgi:ribonuclease P protein component
MKKAGALTKRAQYQRVYKLGTGNSNRYIMMKVVPNNLEISRFGFSVNKPLGKAVVRNRIKRLLKEIIRSQLIKRGWDIVFIARYGSVEADFHQLRKAVVNLLIHADLLADKNEVVNTGVN